MKSLISIVISSFCVLAVLPARGQTQSDQEQVQEQARELFDAGSDFFRDSRFDEAAQAFAESYELFEHPGTLVNLAGALEDANRPAEALRRWRELLDRFGAVISNDARTRARARVVSLERALAPVNVPVSISDPDPVPSEASPSTNVEPSIEGVMAVGDDGASPPALDLELPDDNESETNEGRRGFWRGPWPWIIGGVLVAGAGLGLGLGLRENPDVEWTLR